MHVLRGDVEERQGGGADKPGGWRGRERDECREGGKGRQH